MTRVPYNTSRLFINQKTMKNINFVMFGIIFVLYLIIMFTQIEWQEIEMPFSEIILSKNSQLIILGVGLFFYGKRIIDSYES